MGNHSVRIRPARPQRELPGAEPGAPLVLRFYPSAAAADKGALEYRIISHLAGAGYPVPRPYLFEPGGAAIGAPFLVMQRLGGGPLFAIRSFPQAFKTFSMGLPGFVRAQARLHRMALAPSALEDAARARGSIGNRRTNAVTARRGRLLERTWRPSRRASLRVRCRDWPRRLQRLRRRAPEFRDAPPSFLHLDYHPQNVMVKGLRVPGLSIGPTRQSATAISTPPLRR